MKIKIFYGYWIIATQFITLAILSGLTFYAFSVLNTPIANELDWSRGAVNAAFFIFRITVAIASPFAGKLSDLWGTRKVLFVGTIMVSFALALLSQTSTLWFYYLLYLVIGIGYTLLGPAPASLISSNWFLHRRGTMQGLCFAGIGFGGLVFAPLIGNFLIPNFGWRTACLVMASFLLLILLPIILFIVKDFPKQLGLNQYGAESIEISENSKPKSVTTFGSNLREALGMPTFWVIAITSFFYGLCGIGTFQNQISILTVQNFSMESLVAAVGIVGLFSAMGKFLFGYICDHIDVKYAAAIAYGLVACSLVLIINAHSIIDVWLYSSLIGLGLSGWAPNLAMFTGKYFGMKQYGTILGVLQLFYFTGEALGPMIIGFVYDQTRSYFYILAILAVICFICVPIIILIRKSQE